MIEQRKSIAADGYNSRDTAVQRARRRLKKIVGELEIAKSLSHANIIEYLGGYETSHRICIVHELVDGHDLLQQILDYSKMDERTAAYVFEQLLHAVAYCHSQNVWHRDLKLENVLISTSQHVKLIDFGLSEKSAGRLKTVCGTPLYCAPELLFLNSNTRETGVEGGPADVWSAGVLLFALVTGCAPFDDSTFAALRQDVYRNQVKYPDSMSSSLQEFLRLIFVSDVRRRPSIPELLAHSWLRENVAAYHDEARGFLKGPRTASVISDAETVEESTTSYDEETPEDSSYRDLLYDETTGSFDDELYVSDDASSPVHHRKQKHPPTRTTSPSSSSMTHPASTLFDHLF
ncbi:CAMK/CAMKL protein kinase [Saprolegnia parasitica CBS 223.65]|uniref:CAMK/CAMKL protein kinase n=1 Tax=Saprolegnia parasitica (strain CBS 223.65) TaxID=695850 RepID=A0A067CBY1_SAPPC|nr:CAMK/CAMKL protein kinase [Saprolegnia parasitica CBS 223.65]KDO24322.1 CAMK/CAMKL protein kinase [Saprolegnia parasitica CBS 223.65]|eukprot:XP_012204919.1 CAMK/CAMKL protein kinase [Saprolegnia parasitica CBS 223.65]